MADKAIDKAFLKGLTFTDSRMVKVKDKNSGKESEKAEAFKRELTPEDVSDWKDNGDHVSIVTKDGKKHKVSKLKKEEAKK